MQVQSALHVRNACARNGEQRTCVCVCMCVCVCVCEREREREEIYVCMWDVRVRVCEDVCGYTNRKIHTHTHKECQ